VDPCAGSYEIERRTDAIEREAAALIERIDRLGGTLVAIETGFIQRQIQESAYRAQLAIDRAESVVVGVNRFDSEPAGEIELLQIDPEVERQQVVQVRAVRASRSASACLAALDAVRRTARDGGNLVPPIIDAVEAMATVGEISDVMREVFGEYREAVQD
jgi:methylmalonyl-CoA mutase, N-terminal domain